MDILGSVNDQAAIDFLEKSLLENQFSTPIMRKVVESLGNSGAGQHKLYNLLKAGKLNEEYKITAVLKLMTSWDTEITKMPRNIWQQMERTIPT